MKDETMLNDYDTEICHQTSQRTAALMVENCDHVPGRAACEACIRSHFEVYVRRLTYKFRQVGVGP